MVLGAMGYLHPTKDSKIGTQVAARETEGALSAN